ncbi:MAG: SDR family oxidoreductase [Actinomycetota bacterium]|nr:SDR family oxidoreductase [Actinomycetota bacterium]MDH5223289.1 SDR family oxidoreductase [Actinomycetota bacterium]MDH5314788.1 SDR family oxidoreductase [Actinomycetota bacterium]
MTDGFHSPLAPQANAGKVALVTGGGTGIGRATALEFARTGAAIAICGRRREPIEAATAQLETSGAEVFGATCDVREPEQVAGFLDGVAERFGHIDVLVNNAGGQFAAAAEDISLKGLRAVHRLNIDAVWQVTHEVATRWMIPRRSGSIFFLGFSPRRGIPMMAHSSMARSALETMAASLSNEWSRYGVRAICIAAGLIETEGLEPYGGQQVLAEHAAMVPMRRAGLPEEVGATIAFLASAGGAYITGSTVLVDGGSDAWGQGTAPPELEPPRA